jgi:hypothetical protein
VPTPGLCAYMVASCDVNDDSSGPDDRRPGVTPPVPRLLGWPPEVHHTGRSVGTSTTAPVSSWQVSGVGDADGFLSSAVAGTAY